MKDLSGPIDLIRESLRIFFEKKNFIYFLKVYSPLLILFLLQILWVSFNASGSMEKNLQYFSDKPLLIIFPVIFILLIFVIIGAVFGIWLQAVVLESVLRVVNSGVLDFKDTYKKAWRYAPKLILATAVAGLIIFGGLILFVVPGLIFSVWLFFVNFLVAERNLRIRESLRQSRELVRGRFWMVWGRIIVIGLFTALTQIALSVIPYSLGHLALTIFGALFVLPYYLLYRELQKYSVPSVGSPPETTPGE